MFQSDGGLTAMTQGISHPELFSQMFDDFPAGVMVLDVHTVLVYYNRAQGVLDDLAPAQAVGKNILDLYRVNDNSSYPTLRCLFTRKPLINHACYYYTHLGKLVNSIHDVFPLISHENLVGCICFIREYGQISGQFDTVATALDAPAAPGSAGGAPKVKYTFDQIISQDPAFLRGLDIAAKAASSPSPIMLYGETGCGKEMFAQAIHNLSRRHKKPFVALNCAAVPESLLEGILFGTVKGAFTGALNKPGIMELADGGTIFLDEINSMPLGLQGKMLRVIQEQKIRRVGGSSEKKISLKIVSASNVNPQKAVTDGALRADLLYRLGVVMIGIPPLRDRPADIPHLIRHFIKKLNLRLNKKIVGLSPQMEELFMRYHWPGNARELEHALEGAMNLARDDEQFLSANHLEASLMGSFLNVLAKKQNIASYQAPSGGYESGLARSSMNVGADVGEFETIARALEASGGNAAKAARSLKISPQLMHYKMKKHNLKARVRVNII